MYKNMSAMLRVSTNNKHNHLLICRRQHVACGACRKRPDISRSLLQQLMHTRRQCFLAGEFVTGDRR